MTTPAGGLVYRRLRAPREHGQSLIDPPLDAIASLLDENRRTPPGGECLGRPIAEIAVEARRALWAEAKRHTSRYRSADDFPAEADKPLGADDDSPLIVAGHQPELFHPGVWFKNFLLSSLAPRLKGRAVNVIIDNDLCGSVAVRCPTRRGDAFQFESVEYDRAAQPTPYEERRILDDQRFDSFDQRLAERLDSRIEEPLVHALWDHARRAASAESNLGACLARGRHQLEQQLGLRTLEAPLSRLCGTDAFHWFAGHLLSRADEFRQVHNQTLLDYRRVNRVRSQTHPVPALARRQDWTEAPFWMWTDRNPVRRPVFVRSVEGALWISDSHDDNRPLKLPADPGPLIEALRGAAADGVRLRPRALITTTFLRLLSSDLFIHGVGGGKYDQLTDEILRRFFGVVPPGFVIATASASLPLPLSGATEEDVRRVARLLRELTFQPEKHINPTEEVADLLAEKRRWIETHPPLGAGKPRREHILRANEALQPYLAEQRAEARRKLLAMTAQCRVDRQLGSREFSFCLHSQQTLPRLLLDLCGERH